MISQDAPQSTIGIIVGVGTLGNQPVSRRRTSFTTLLGVMKTIAISGSLRADSINSAFCRAAVRLAPTSLQVTVYTCLGDLPLFNPDLEANLPAVVQSFRITVADADALIIASPEYAHGVSGAMKNALDWLVSFEGVVSKPIALVNTSPRAHHAYEALREILQTMSTVIVPEASMAIPLLGSCITEEAMVNSPEVSHAIRDCLRALAHHLAGTAVQGPSFPLA